MGLSYEAWDEAVNVCISAGLRNEAHNLRLLSQFSILL